MNRVAHAWNTFCEACWWLLDYGKYPSRNPLRNKNLRIRIQSDLKALRREFGEICEEIRKTNEYLHNANTSLRIDERQPSPNPRRTEILLEEIAELQKNKQIYQDRATETDRSLSLRWDRAQKWGLVNPPWKDKLAFLRGTDEEDEKAAANDQEQNQDRLAS